MTIAARLFLGFLVSILLLIGLGIFALNQIGAVRNSTVSIIDHDIWAYRSLQGLVRSQVNLLDARRVVLVDFLLRQEQLDPSDTVDRKAAGNLPDALEHWKQLADDLSNRIGRALTVTTGYEQTALSSGSLSRADTWHGVTILLQQAQQQWGGLRADAATQLAAIEASNMPAVIGAEPKLVADNAELSKTLAQVEEALASGSGAGAGQIKQLYARGRTLLIIAISIAVVLLIGIAWLILRSIIRPLDAFTAFAERVGRGDLTGEPLKTGGDELGRLAATLNAMANSLKQVTGQSRELTSALNASAAQIRASTQEQAASVEQQLAALQETAATADEITHSGARITQRAQEVIGVAQQAVQTSAQGLRAVSDAARAMDAIREQGEVVATNIVALSEKTQVIGEIITTVNDISERAHLLALNAAIEAAAAGESGRSFSVVAAELKVLADQAKQATVQVRSILGEIQRGINASVMMTEEAVKRVAVGRERSDVTERTIEAITASVQESVQTFQQIVASTNQHQIGIEQVMGALQNIRQASQQTAAGTRELDLAAGSLAELSSQLLLLGERYKI